MIPDGFRHTVPMPVRFADIDAMGHVNHAKYLTYMEHARILYVEEICGWSGDWQTLGMILAKITVDYKLPIAYGDSISVYTRCSRLGSKSFDLEYTLIRHRPNQDDAVAATGLSVMVAYDYKTDQTIPIADGWRKRLLAYEPLLTN